MTDITCPRCSYVRTRADTVDAQICPGCGRYYAKMAAMTEPVERTDLPPPKPAAAPQQQEADKKGRTMRTKADNEKFCAECGEVILAKAEICPHCGCRQPGFGGPGDDADPSLLPEKERRHKGAAALVALFLGGLGIHKFYLGQTGQGVLYLLFCWTFIPALLGFLECLVYLTTSQADFDAKYNQKPR